jgi:hypothetical protein
VQSLPDIWGGRGVYSLPSREGDELSMGSLVAGSMYRLRDGAHYCRQHIVSEFRNARIFTHSQEALEFRVGIWSLRLIAPSDVLGILDSDRICQVSIVLLIRSTTHRSEV